jgi:uncharacterized protein (TIGR02757 family)
LDFKASQYNDPSFIETDPIVIPHGFSVREDIELSGLLVALIAWGNRKAIIQSGHKLMTLMGNAPYDFIMSHTARDLDRVSGFVHRTFNGRDLSLFIRGLKKIYQQGGMEKIFAANNREGNLREGIRVFREMIFREDHELRSEKHLPDIERGSAAKRINMFLRWMVRRDNKGVDFGLWKTIPPSVLSCPLDVHSGRVARKLGLLKRKQNDAVAVEELDAFLRSLDRQDPVKYDFALFGLGVFEKF